MSGCGGSCKCGSDCKCGNGCGCGMHLDITEKTVSTTIIEGVAPVKMFAEGTENNLGAEGSHTCKCGPNCSCNPCKC